MVLTPGMQNFKLSLASLFQHLEIFINYPSVPLVSAGSLVWIAHSFRSWQIIKDILIKLIPWNNCGSHTSSHVSVQQFSNVALFQRAGTTTTTFSVSVKTVPTAVNLGLYFVVFYYSWFLASTWFFKYSSQHLWKSVSVSFIEHHLLLWWWNTWIWLLRLRSSYMSKEPKTRMFLMWINTRVQSYLVVQSKNSYWLN